MMACLMVSLVVVCRVSARIGSAMKLPLRGPEPGGAQTPARLDFYLLTVGDVQGLDAREIVNIDASAVLAILGARDGRGTDGVMDDLRVTPSLVEAHLSGELLADELPHVEPPADVAEGGREQLVGFRARHDARLVGLLLAEAEPVGERDAVVLATDAVVHDLKVGPDLGAEIALVELRVRDLENGPHRHKRASYFYFLHSGVSF